MSRYFLVATLLSILLFASLTVNRTNATHTDCTNWAGLPDKDCDQLADIWETSKTYTESGVTVNLPQAVDMNHRDILVEIDYMSHHIPTAASLNIVVNK